MLKSSQFGIADKILKTEGLNNKEDIYSKRTLPKIIGNVLFHFDQSHFI